MKNIILKIAVVFLFLLIPVSFAQASPASQERVDPATQALFDRAATYLQSIGWPVHNFPVYVGQYNPEAVAETGEDYIQIAPTSYPYFYFESHRKKGLPDLWVHHVILHEMMHTVVSSHEFEWMPYASFEAGINTEEGLAESNARDLLPRYIKALYPRKWNKVSKGYDETGVYDHLVKVVRAQSALATHSKPHSLAAFLWRAKMQRTMFSDRVAILASLGR